MACQVRFEPSARVLDFEANTSTLLELTKAAGLPIASACGESGTCARCGLEILQGRDAIDPETEHLIRSAMDSAMHGRTTFIVAHRLSTLKRADRVIVLEAGRITEIGTHDELMQTSEHYRSAAEVQLADDDSKRLLGIG